MAVIGNKQKKMWIRFGGRPPTAYTPKGDYDPNECRRAAERINAKKAQMVRFWHEKRHNKLWTMVRQAVNMNQ
jgi:hypothetical protein